MSTLKAKNFHLIEDLDIAAATFAAIERVEGFVAKVTGSVQLWVRRSNDRRFILTFDITSTRSYVHPFLSAFVLKGTPFLYTFRSS